MVVRPWETSLLGQIGNSKMKIELQETFQFEAAHSLPRLPENHKCYRLNGHSFKSSCRGNCLNLRLQLRLSRGLASIRHGYPLRPRQHHRSRLAATL